MKQVIDTETKAEDISTTVDTSLEKKLHDLEDRVKSIERLLMQIVDKLELDYPGITL